MLRHYFSLALRNLIRQKQTTLIGIAGLVIAFSVVLQITQWCSFESSYDRYNRKADRIYRFTVEESKPEENFYWHFARCWQPWRTKLPGFYPEIECLLEMRPMMGTAVRTPNSAFYTDQAFEVDSTMFQVFDFDFLEGIARTALEAKNTAVVSESFAKKLFPGQDALSKVFELDGDHTDGFEKHTITGIYKDMPANAHFHADVLVHYNHKPVNGNDFAFTYILLKKGTNIGQITSRNEAFIKSHVPEDQQKSSIIHYMPLTDIHLKSHIEREIEPNGEIRQVRLFIYIGLGILLIALINYINLQLAAFEKRSKYFHLSVTVGARVRHNMGLLLMESFCIALVVLLVSALLFRPLTGLLVFAGVIQHHPVSVGLEMVLVGLALVVLVLLSGVLPLLVARLKPSAFFSHRTSGLFHQKTALFNNPLLILQFTVCIVVIICSLMMNKQNRFLFSRNLGFGNENIVLIPRKFYSDEESQIMRFKEELLKTSAVSDVTMSMDSPGYLTKDARRAEEASIPDENKKLKLTILPVDGNFFSFFHIPLVAGSEKEYVTGQQRENYILNEAAIRKLGYPSAADAIGTPFKLEDFGDGNIKGGRITGVVKDFSFSSLYNPIEPTVFFQKPIWQFHYLVKLAPGNKVENLDVVKQVWNKVYPEYPFDYEFLDQTYRQQYYSKDLVTNKLVGWFSIICLILSSIGLWGMTSILMLRKTKEIGVRKVNGATPLEILGMQGKGYAVKVAAAFLIAMPVACYFLQGWLENFAYRTELSWWIFGVAGLLALVIALLTVGGLSWKVSTSNPVEALRCE